MERFFMRKSDENPYDRFVVVRNSERVASKGGLFDAYADSATYKSKKAAVVEINDD